jgi:hypothetical protein
MAALRVCSLRCLPATRAYAPRCSNVSNILKSVGLRTKATSSGAPATNPVFEGMPRYANLTVPGMLRLMDWTGTGLFAFTGAITAASSGEWLAE